MIRVVNNRPICNSYIFHYVLCNFAYIIDPDVYLFLMQKLLAG